MIFWKDPQSRECEGIEKADINVIQGTGEGTASGRNTEIPRIVFNLGLMSLPLLYTNVWTII